MLEKAVAHYQEVGRVQALADFNARKAPFFDRDLYVFCIGPNHIITANGGYPQYVGGAPDVLRDAEGKPVAKAILDAVSDKDEGSVQYRWLNPGLPQDRAQDQFCAQINRGCLRRWGLQSAIV